jgi:predicted dehydrogenase
LEITPGNHFALEMDHMAQCVLEDKTPKTPGAEGLQDVKIITAIYEAAKSGQAVKIA